MTPEMGMAAEADAMALTGSLAEWASGSAYLNFVESEMDASTAFPSRTWERLKAIRSAVDPDGDLRRQPRDPPGLTHRRGRSSARYGALRICRRLG